MSHLLIVVSLAALFVLVGTSSWAENPIYQIPFTQTTCLNNWLLFGPLPDTTPEDYTQDLLVSSGGESQISVDPTTIITFNGTTFGAGSYNATENGIVSLTALCDNTKHCLVYAYSELMTEEPQEAVFRFAADSDAKLWLNGDLVCNHLAEDEPPVIPVMKDYKVQLQKGRNRVLVKTRQASDGDWRFRVEAITKDDLTQQGLNAAQLDRTMRFLKTEVGPINRLGYVFPPGNFPMIVWFEPELVTAYCGELPDLHVRWFDNEGNEVLKPETSGRYGAYVEADLPDGHKFQRAITILCHDAIPTAWRGTHVDVTLAQQSIAWVNGDRSTSPHMSEIEKEAGWKVSDALYKSAWGGAMLAALYEHKPVHGEITQLDTLLTSDQDFQLLIKREILGVDENIWPALQPPHKREGAPATVLHPESPATAGFKQGFRDNVREVCREWVALEGEPVSVCIARNGAVAMHEAFGEINDEPITVHTKLPLASLTKMQGGLMLAQFIDQGILDLDDPVGKFLPGFPTEGPKAITLRHCMCHTTGYEGHAEFDGMKNPWLENPLMLALDLVQPGVEYKYNGMGMDLAAKVMEVVSGKSCFRLMHENFFIPLGQDNPTMEDFGFGIVCTVEDLARVGQLLLNKGSYGDVEFISEATFDSDVWPRPLGEFFPNLKGMKEHAYNLGIHFAPDVRAGTEEKLFSDRTLMHGAASGAILRVDFETGLVVALGRRTPGARYEEFCQKFLTTVVDSIE